MNLDQALESWMIDLRSRNCSERTQETYGLAVRQLIDWLKNGGHSLRVAEITTTDLRGFMGHLLTTRSDATAQQRYRSLRATIRCWLSNPNVVTTLGASITTMPGSAASHRPCRRRWEPGSDQLCERTGVVDQFGHVAMVTPTYSSSFVGDHLNVPDQLAQPSGQVNETLVEVSGMGLEVAGLRFER